MSEQTPPQTVEEYRAAQEAEWGQYVANEAIDINGVRAFNAGNAVPVSHVERGVVDKSQVRDVKAEAAKAERAAAKSSDEKKG